VADSSIVYGEVVVASSILAFPTIILATALKIVET
jgi:hypothetical protein